MCGELDAAPAAASGVGLEGTRVIGARGVDCGGAAAVLAPVGASALG